MSPEHIFFTNLEDLKENLTTLEPEGKNFDLMEKSKDESSWYLEDYEGQLSVDVYQTEMDIIVKATIAGVAPKDVHIFLNDDMLTIRGKRQQDEEARNGNYIYKECFWGGFSRSIILPVEINPSQVKASLKNGVLTVRMPKMERSRKINIDIHED